MGKGLAAAGLDPAPVLTNRPESFGPSLLVGSSEGRFQMALSTRTGATSLAEGTPLRGRGSKSIKR
jgi:hypothetical protein